MTLPDINALNRPSLAIDAVPEESTPEALVCRLSVAGNPVPGRLMVEPEALERLTLALSPGPVVAQVVNYIKWVAGAYTGRGKEADAATLQRLAAWLAGETDDPIGGIAADEQTCEVTEDDGRVCGKGNARQCKNCSRTYCVQHWHNAKHPCLANRPKRDLPPPLVPVKANDPVVAVLERVAATG